MIRDVDTEFRCDFSWVAPRVLLIEYVGHMPADAGYARATEERVFASAAPVAVCYDLTRQRSFHRAQVPLHAQVFARLGPRVAGFALVGAHPAARFGAVTVSLVARLTVRTFEQRPPAIHWLRSLLD